MKYLIAVFILLSSGLSQAAYLYCSLLEGPNVVEQKALPISLDGDPSTFKFNFDLKGKDYFAQVAWDEQYAIISMKANADSVAASQTFKWEDPLDQQFVMKHGNAKINCNVNVSDGLSWRWKAYREDIGLEVRLILIKTDTIIQLASIPAETPNDSARVNNAICMTIGSILDGENTKALYLRLI